MKQKIKINGAWVEYESRIAVDSLNEIPQEFMAKFYNGAYEFYYKNKYVYAIPTVDAY